MKRLSLHFTLLSTSFLNYTKLSTFRKMKRITLHIRRATLMLLTALVAFPICSQSENPVAEENHEPNVIERIVEESGGNIDIIINDELTEKILKAPASHKKQGNTNTNQRIRPGINKMQGYRIQVFSDGRNQHSLESRAKARGAAISARLPKYRGQVYTFSSSPNWYTRVGNFRSMAEANQALSELRSVFPNFANEMRVVKCQIVVIK